MCALMPQQQIWGHSLAAKLKTVEKVDRTEETSRENRTECLASEDGDEIPDQSGT